MKGVRSENCSICSMFGITWGILKNTPMPANNNKIPHTNCIREP